VALLLLLLLLRLRSPAAAATTAAPASLMLRRRRRLLTHSLTHLASLRYFATGGHGWLLSRKEWSLEQDPIVDDAVFKWVVVPLCLTGPLWLRFLQSLRRAHESRQRWPHLGNAGKYALAQTVALAGIYNPGLHSSPAWVAAFVLATCYQFAWDIFMDWNLLT
jgi:hypothetical protein